MAFVTFTQLPNLGNITGNDIIPVVSANVNYKVTAANLQSFVNGGNGNITSNNITATGVIQGATLSALGNVNCGNLNLTGNIVDPASSLQIRSGGTIDLVPTTQVNVTAPINVTGNVSATGNVLGNYLLANIFFASGYNANKIYNGISEINIGVPNGPANISIGGTSNVAVFTTLGMSLPGQVTANAVLANSITAVNQITGATISATGNMIAGNVNLSGNIVDSSALTIQAGGNITLVPTGQTQVIGNLSVSGNLLANVVSTNITANIVTANTLVVNSSANIAQLRSYAEFANAFPAANTTSSFTPDYNNGIIQGLTANANFTLNAPLNLATGSSITLIITQDAVGNRAMTANSVYRFAYGVNTLSTSPNTTDMMTIFKPTPSGPLLCNLVKGYV
jgi:hypothetical protein